MSTSKLQVVGEVLLGKYVIDRVLGQGGMGVVFAATHVEIRQKVAIKVILPAICGVDAMAVRILREARAAAAIRNEHVCRVLDVERTEEGIRSS